MEGKADIKGFKSKYYIFFIRIFIRSNIYRIYTDEERKHILKIYSFVDI